MIISSNEEEEKNVVAKKRERMCCVYLKVLFYDFKILSYEATVERISI